MPIDAAAPINATAPTDVIPKKDVTIFISYAKADRPIADTLVKELCKINAAKIECFLDTETIAAGEGWQKKIDDALTRADWLVCVYTGEQSEFCGYEVGVFLQSRNDDPPGKDRRLVCLHDVADLPTVFSWHQNSLVTHHPKSNAASKNDDELQKRAFYGHAPLAKFFRSVYAYKDLYVTHNAPDNERQLQLLSEQVESVSKAFQENTGSDVKSNTPTQLSLQILVSKDARANTESPLRTIPLNAEVTGTSASFELFNLAPPMLTTSGGPRSTTWDKVRLFGSDPKQGVPPWIVYLERDMLNAANGVVLNAPETTFVSRTKIYCAILSRWVELYNGSYRFEVIFVETLPRSFLGNKSTSLLLAGIVLASRFRFAYLEEPLKRDAKFSDNLSNEEFEANSRQLGYDLERIQHEAFEHGLLEPAELTTAFGDDLKAFAEEILHSAAEKRAQLLECLPKPQQTVTDENRADIKKAVKRYFAAVEPINARFLQKALEIYQREINRQLKVTARQRGDATLTADATLPAPAGKDNTSPRASRKSTSRRKRRAGAAKALART